MGNELVHKEKTTTLANMGEVLTCDKCYLGERCPYYTPGSTCQLNFTTEVNTPEDLQGMVKLLIEQGFERLQRSLFIEKVDGGYLNKDVTDEMQNYIALLTQMRDLLNPQDTLEVKAKGKGAAEVLSKLFSGKLGDNKNE